MSLKILKEVKDLLANSGLTYWVTGGYALDIVVTREHKNADFIIRLFDAGRVQTILEKNDFDITISRQKLTARKNLQTANLLTMDEQKKEYIIPLLNAEITMPVIIMNEYISGELDYTKYRRIPNELIYLLMNHSPITADSIIARNLKIDKKILKQIKVNLRKTSLT